jgi:hypothetical protein
MFPIASVWLVVGCPTDSPRKDSTSAFVSRPQASTFRADCFSELADCFAPGCRSVSRVFETLHAVIVAIEIINARTIFLTRDFLSFADSSIGYPINSCVPDTPLEVVTTLVICAPASGV